MQPTTKIASLILVIITVLITVPAAMSDQRVNAQSSDDVRYHCANLDLWMRECPQWSCGTMLKYSRGTLLFVHDTVTGDREAGSDEWLLVEDPVQHIRGYVHSTQAWECEPEPWMTRPVVPRISPHVQAIYARGLSLGNDPTRFSKIGDCQNVTAYYLSHFDHPMQYDLGPFSDLQTTIDHFAGSFARESAAVEGGYTVASVLSPIWADPSRCESDETPLLCEERLYNPSIVIISMETWSRTGYQPPELYEEYLGNVVEFWIERGVVPIVGTKADNLEGDHSINQAIVRVADKYEIPLWNFWLAAQSLPDGGLQDPERDRFHLLWARSFYNNIHRLRDGWPVRNLTALQAIDAVWTAVKSTDAAAPTDVEDSTTSPGAINDTAPVNSSEDEAHPGQSAAGVEIEAGQVVEDYLLALTQHNAEAAYALACDAWVDQVAMDLGSFSSVDAVFDDVVCTTTEATADEALVTCSGALLVTYDGDTRRLPLSGTTYRLRWDSQTWKLCGQN